MGGFGVRVIAVAGLLAAAGCSSGTPIESPGFEMLASKNYAAAEAYFTNEVAEDPNDPYAHLNLAAAHEAQGNFALAAQHYQAAIELGEGAPVGRTVFNGQVKDEDSTVAAVAAYNLSNLPQ